MESIKGYIIEGGKRVTYTAEEDRIIYSDGKEVAPGIASTDFKKAYALAAVPSIPVEPPIVVKPDTQQIDIGSGSGRIDIADIIGVTYKVKSGNYDAISIKRCKNVSLLLGGVNIIYGNMDVESSTNIETVGGSFKGNKVGAIRVSGLVNGLVLKGVTFFDVSNYLLSYEHQVVYNGKDETVSKDWKIEGCSFEKTNQIFNSKSDLKPEGVMTLMRNFKFLNNSVKNCPSMGGVVSLGAVDGYDIAGNIIDNVNMSFPDPRVPNGPHNGIFTMVGWGSCRDNKLTNHQGNLIRAWGVSFDDQVREVLIYNNKVHNSWKYSAFELQVPPYISEYKAKYPDRVFYTNAKVYNNTAGHLSVSKDWDGQMLDLYNTYGKVEYYNNLGFDMVASNPIYHPVNNMINNNYDQDKTQLVESNNKYARTAIEAVEDAVSFKSKFAGIGAQ